MSMKYSFKKNKSLIYFGIIIYIFFIILFIVFKQYRNFFAYISIVYLIIFFLYLLLSIHKERKSIISLNQWLAKKDYSNLDKNLSDNPFLKIIKEQDMIIKDFESKKELSDKDFKDYVTNWTHQIKSPIFALNLLLDDENIDGYLAKNELFRIEEYVQNILAYIRFGSKDTDYSFSNNDLDEMIKTSIKKYANQIILKKNRIEFSKSNKIILTDSKWFCFILEQIISNSNKYTSQGYIRIYLEENKLIIEDNGIGIKEEDLPRIFEKSYTGSNGRLDKKASGIGLSLVKDIASSLRIDVSAKSEVGSYTKLIFDLSKIIQK